MGRIIKLKNNPVITPDELDRQAVGTAVVILHGEGRYYEALDLLCRVVGWPSLVRGFASENERDAWLAKVRGVPAAGETISAKRETKMKKCGTCGRWRDPAKTLQRKFKNACRECGRGFRGNK
jgi:hypothetical protein